MVVFVHPLLCPSWLHLISAQSILTKLISGTHPELKLVPMVFHATVEKATTWKAPLLLSQLRCPQECPFSPKVASRRDHPINVQGDMNLTVLLQSNVPGGTQSHPTQTVTPHLPQSQSLHRSAQARRCLKQLQRLDTR